MTDRVEFTKKVRVEAFVRAGGLCENPSCKAKLKVGEAEYDHRIPFYISRDSSIENCQVLCVPCHRGPGAKTADDQRTIAKIKRVKMKHEGTFPPTSRPIPSRTFTNNRREASK